MRREQTSPSLAHVTHHATRADELLASCSSSELREAARLLHAVGRSAPESFPERESVFTPLPLRSVAVAATGLVFVTARIQVDHRTPRVFERIGFVVAGWILGHRTVETTPPAPTSRVRPRPVPPLRRLPVAFSPRRFPLVAFPSLRFPLVAFPSLRFTLVAFPSLQFPLFAFPRLAAEHETCTERLRNESITGTC